VTVLHVFTALRIQNGTFNPKQQTQQT
jgi:hypothetical protein